LHYSTDQPGRLRALGRVPGCKLHTGRPALRGPWAASRREHGTALFEGRFAPAIESYAEGVKVNPQDVIAQVRLGQLRKAFAATGAALAR